jgi:hypothetical protein
MRKLSHKARRRIVRVALGLVGVVVAAIAAAVIVLHTDWGREQVRVRLEDQLGKVFVGGASVGKIEGSPFGELVARDVVIRDPAGGPAITAKTVRIRLAILPLISKEARLSTVIVDGAEVNLERDEHGDLRVAHLLRPGPKTGWSADLPDIRIHGGHVAYDTGRGERVNLDGVELKAEARIPFARPLGVSVNLTAQWRERGLPLELDAIIRTDDDGLSIGRLFARAGELVVTGQDVRIAKSSSQAGAPAISGTVSVDAPRAAVARLGFGLETPANLSVRATASRDAGSPWTRLAVSGLIDGTPVTGQVRADLDARHFTGFVATGVIDATTLSRGQIEGSASAFVSFDAALPPDRELPVGTAMLHAWGTIEGVPDTEARIALSSTGERASALVELAGRALRANASAEVLKSGGALTLERARLTAATADPQRATGGAAPVHGAFHADLTASGALAPQPSLAVAGTVDGQRLRFRDLSIDSLKLAIDARQLPSRPRGRAKLDARGVVRGTMNLIELGVTAADRPDGKLAVAVRTRPKQHPWLIEADALVTTGEVVGIELLRHHVRAGSGADWRGTSGRVAIAPDRIELRDFATHSGSGGLSIAGVYYRSVYRGGRRTGDLEARIEATSLGLDNIDQRFRGTASGRVEVERRGGRLVGHAELAGRGIAIEPKVAPIDADAKIDVREGRLAVDARASGPRLGRVGVVAELDAPRDASAARAWQALGRSAIRSGRVTLERVDLGRLAVLAGREGEHRGVVNGELQLTATGASGAVTVRGLLTPATQGLGPVDADLQLTQTGRGELQPSLAVRLPGLGAVDARAAIVMPAHPFDPVAWRRLGRGAIANAWVRTSELAFDPGVLDRFGIHTNLRGRATVSLELDEGMRVARLSGRIRDLRGKPIAEPVAVELTATSGEEATTFRLIAGTPAARFVDATGRIARSFAQLQASAAAARRAPLTATVKLPAMPARQLLVAFGRTDVLDGSLSGTIDIAGTLGTPTARARLTAEDIALPPGPANRRTKKLERLTLDATWNGQAAAVVVTGTEPGGVLRVVANGSPAALGRATLTMRATQFDLRPVLVFVPGAVGASGGVLDASLSVTSLDPRTMKAIGELHLAEARVPLAPAIGTLRRAKIDVIAGERDLRLRVAGHLGDGTVTADGTVALVGAAPSGGDLTLTLRKVSPIGAVEPQIDADVKMKVTKAQDRWIADVEVHNGDVRVPKGRGEKLKPVGPPTDMVFVNGGPAGRRPRKEEPPERPVIEARIHLGATHIESEEVRAVVRGNIKVTADGDSVGIVGAIEAYRGDVDLFGRRYLVERAAARFDGPPDPVLDIVITHDFPEVTTITTVRGRLSKPELIMSSDPGLYSQGQLLGFLLGGEPNGQPATGSPRDQVTAAGTSLIANRLGGYVKKALPFSLDVLRYEAATASSSAAFTVGTWLTRSLFVSYRRRFEARADENTGEAEAEYWLTRRVMFEGVLGDRGYSGLDLLWRKRY